jgi:Transposase DDE domain.
VINLKYSTLFFENTKSKIYSKEIISLARKNQKDFTRIRKLTVKDLILYDLNKRGLTTKMELEDFIMTCNLEQVSDSALLKQREKLNPDVFKYLNDDNIGMFYTQYQSDVKTFKNHIVLAIDGSDWEIPNTPCARESFGTAKNQNSQKCARMKVSTCFDIFNCFVLDTEIEKYKFSELKLAERHLVKAKELVGDFPIISVMDRGYNSLATLYESTSNGDKFVIRLTKSTFKAEQQMMKNDDEWVEIKYQYDRIRHYKDKHPKLYKFYKDGHTIKVRFVKIPLKTGELETLVTNLDSSLFSTEDIARLYQLRWGIETNYHYLKESMKLTNISSSKKDIIKQEIFSQMLVFNLLQAVQNEVAEDINQEKYKHKMKININMAVGYIKRYFIIIMLTDDLEERKKLYDVLEEKILKNIVPIREERKSDRGINLKNKYHINKRKSF